MVVRFLGIPLEQIDDLCKDKDLVKISISLFKNTKLKHEDGTSSIEQVLTSEWSGSIRSSKDIFQFDYDDLKKLDSKTRASLV